MARPRKEIDQKQFENLCGLQCTLEEICGWFDVTDKTLDSWCKRTYHASFSEVFRQKRGAVVLDLFGGSGSTLIACEQLERNCYMMELDPRYCDVIIKRWENFTGEKAKLITE